MNDTEYLEELFACMDIYLLDYIEKNKAAIPAVLTGHSSGADGAISFLKARMTSRDLEQNQVFKDWQKTIRQRREFTLDIGKELYLEAFLDSIGGDDFIRNVLVITMMCSLNRQYSCVIQYLNQNDGANQVTPLLCIRLFLCDSRCSDIKNYLGIRPYYDVLCHIFPQFEAAGVNMDIPLVCDTRLLDILLKQNDCLPEGSYIIESGYTADQHLLFREEEISLMEKLILEMDFPMTMLYGAQGSGKKHILKHLAEKTPGFNLIFYSLPTHYSSESTLEEVKKHIMYILRECLLFNRYMVLTDFESLNEVHKEELLEWLENHIRSRVLGIFIINQSEAISTEAGYVYGIEMRQMNSLQMIGVWEYYLENQVMESDFSLETLANTFLITPGQIRNAIGQAKRMSVVNGAIKTDALYRACYTQLKHQLSQKAACVKPSFRWEDLKMNAPDKTVLRDICNCVKNRHTVLNQWNFKKIVPYGGGITVLFSGPPGTGKTMAAQVIADELHMELYKIDLSHVIDKYVGETEKNIRLIFQQAQKSNSILFFDEADAIFSKRMEASNANERFANIESSLLLQCIEDYGGITILATNNFSAIDSAFIRRFKYYLLFKEPDESTRYDIWMSVFPKEAPVNTMVDFKVLAHIFEFTGAVIKNVVLAAAYLAAEEKREIMLIDILRSIRREMSKNNLILSKEKLGSLGYLYDEVMIDP